MTSTAAPTGYRAVLRLPGVTPLVALSLVARLPSSAAAITLTLHVVLTLDLGYAAAGAVGAASTVGMAVGAPLLGRLVDRRGLRTMLGVTIVSAALFWAVAPSLSYPVLLVVAFFGGLLSTPVYSVIRQSLAALVPQGQRRPAFALDSMAVELSYIVGPTAGSLLVVQAGSRTAMAAVGVASVASGLALWALNPATRVGDPADDGPAPAVREWLDRRLVGALLVTSASVMLIFGTELSVIAAVQVSGPVYAIAVVNAVWGLSSLVGGFVYGAASRSYSVFALAAALGVATLLVALGGPWWSFALLLVPAGLLTAPSLAASSERVSTLAPESARGVVTGLHGSAITLGAAVGTPLAGVLIDAASPAAAVLVIGATGTALAGVAALIARPPRTAGVSTPRPARLVAAHRVAAGVATALAAVVVLPDLLGLDGRSPFAQVVAFRPWTLAGLVAVTAIVGLVAVRRRGARPVAAGLLVVALAGAALVLPRAVPEPVPSGGVALTVLALNVFDGSADVDEVAALLRAERPDLVALPEAGERFVARLAPLVGPLGYRVHTGSGASAADVGAVTALVADGLGEVRVEVGRATSLFPTVEVTGGGLGALRFVAYHAAAPVPDLLSDWAADLALLATWCAGGGPVVVAGDLNATLDHSALRTGAAGCADAAERRGAGLVPTWGPGARWRAVGPQIDHVLVGGGIAAERFAVHDVTGTDHRAVVARLRVP